MAVFFIITSPYTPQDVVTENADQVHLSHLNNFYLPSLNQTNLSKPQKHEGLRWGIIGLGRIAHDFTSV